MDVRLLSTFDCPGITNAAISDIVRVLVIAANSLVHVEKLCRRNDACIQRSKPILHADIVERAKRKSRYRIDPVHASCNVEDRRTSSQRVTDRVVTKADWNRRIPYRGSVTR